MMTMSRRRAITPQITIRSHHRALAILASRAVCAVRAEAVVEEVAIDRRGSITSPVSQIGSFFFCTGLCSAILLAMRELLNKKIII